MILLVPASLMTGDGEPGPWSPLIQGNTVIDNHSAGDFRWHRLPEEDDSRNP